MGSRSKYELFFRRLVEKVANGPKYPELGRAAQNAIPGAGLVEFPGLGHAPQMEEPVTFNHALTMWMMK